MEKLRRNKKGVTSELSGWGELWGMSTMKCHVFGCASLLASLLCAPQLWASTCLHAQSRVGCFALELPPAPVRELVQVPRQPLMLVERNGRRAKWLGSRLLRWHPQQLSVTRWSWGSGNREHLAPHSTSVDGKCEARRRFVGRNGTSVKHMCGL